MESSVVGVGSCGLVHTLRVRIAILTKQPLQNFNAALCVAICLPQKDAGRWGQGLTAEKMKACIWVKPQVVVRIDFLEWTGADHLRHTKVVSLGDDKDPKKVVREEN